MRKPITDIRRAREHFKKVSSIPVVLGFKPSTYYETKKTVRTTGPLDERGVATTIKRDVVEGHCRGTMTDFELLICWNHLSDDEVMRIVNRSSIYEDPRTPRPYQPMKDIAKRVAELRGLL